MHCIQPCNLPFLLKRQKLLPTVCPFPPGGQFHHGSGGRKATPRSLGNWHASALISTTISGEENCGRPRLGRSSRPRRRWSKKRLRHIHTICRGKSSRSPISLLDKPWEAKRTILARMTSQCDDVYFRAIVSRSTTLIQFPVVDGHRGEHCTGHERLRSHRACLEKETVIQKI